MNEPTPSPLFDAPEPERDGAAKDAFSPGFVRFWDAWPKNGEKPFSDYTRKKNRPGAWKKWKDRRLEKSADAIVLDIERRKKYDKEWRKQNGAFIVGPVVYLNQEHWTEEFADLRDERKPIKPQASSGASERDDGPSMSPRARAANRYFLSLLRACGGFGEELVLRMVAVKDEIVSEADRNDWAQDEFVDILPSALRKELEAGGRKWPK